MVKRFLHPFENCPVWNKFVLRLNVIYILETVIPLANKISQFAKEQEKNIRTNDIKPQDGYEKLWKKLLLPSLNLKGKNIAFISH